GRPLWVRGESGYDTVSGQALQGQPQPQQTSRHVDVVTLRHYTREAPIYCDGSPAPGELVVEYENIGGGWMVSTRHSIEDEELAPMFAPLGGEMSFEDGGREDVLGRQARRLQAPWAPQDRQFEERLPTGAVITSRTFSAGPPLAGALQALFIDEETLLPLRFAFIIPRAAFESASPGTPIPP